MVITPISTPFEPNQVLTAHDNGAKDKAGPFIYRSIIGMLMFCVTISCCECAYQVKELSRHLNNPSNAHMAAARQVARYLYHTWDKGIVFNRSPDGHGLLGFSDSNFCNCVDTRRSTSG